MTDMPALLEARGLRKHLGGRPIVNGVDPSATPGRCWASLVPTARPLRGLLLGAAAGAHLAGLAVLVAVMLAVLVPLAMRLLRKRVLGD